MFFEDRHYTRSYEKALRNNGAFILSTIIAPPPQHTLLHRSMTEPPRPDRIQVYDMLEMAKETGLRGVVEQIDTPVTDHLRRQLAILAIPSDEAIDRLTRKMYVKQVEHCGV